MFKKLPEIFTRPGLLFGKKNRSNDSGEQLESSFPTESDNPHFAEVVNYVCSKEFIDQIVHIKHVLRTYGDLQTSKGIVTIGSDMISLSYHEKEHRIDVGTGIFFKTEEVIGTHIKKPEVFILNNPLYICFYLGDKLPHMSGGGYEELYIGFVPHIIPQLVRSYRKIEDVNSYLKRLTHEVSKLIPGKAYTTTVS